MSLCPPNYIFDFFKPGQRFTCMIPNPAFPGEDQCALGCSAAQCDDHPDALAGHNAARVSAPIRSRGWIRPSDTGFGRDAWGKIAPIISWERSLLTAFGGSFTSAPCFFYTNQSECFDDSICDCYYDRRVSQFTQTEEDRCFNLVSQGRCCDGSLFGQLWVRKSKQCNVFSGTSWPPSIFECRRIEDVEPKTFQITPGPYLNTQTTQINAPCTVNMMVAATGHSQGSPCQGSWHQGFITNDRPVPEFYNTSATFERFRNLTISPMNMSVGGGVSNSRAIQNAALAMFRTFPVISFPVNESQSINFAALQNVTIADDVGNERLGLWAREWDGPSLVRNHSIGVGRFPTVAVLSGKMRTGGCPITGRVAISRVAMKAHITAINGCLVNEAQYDSGGTATQSLSTKQEMYLSVRLFLDIDLVVIADELRDCRIVRPWSTDVPVSIVNSPDGSTNAIGVNDKIEWQYQGKPLRVPGSARWRGYYGQYGIPGSRMKNLWGIGNPRAAGRNCATTLRSATCAILGNLRGLKIYGWPTSIESDASATLYNGSIEFGILGSLTGICAGEV